MRYLLLALSAAALLTGCMTPVSLPRAVAVAPANAAGPTIAVPDFADFTRDAHGRYNDSIFNWHYDNLPRAAADEVAARLAATGKYARVVRVESPFDPALAAYGGYDLVVAGYVDTFRLRTPEPLPPVGNTPVQLVRLGWAPPMDFGPPAAAMQVNLIDVQAHRGQTSWNVQVTQPLDHPRRIENPLRYPATHLIKGTELLNLLGNAFAAQLSR